jgi:hypothetical protein
MTDKTDLPWCVDAQDNIFDKDGNRIAQVWGGDIVQDNARSALIVRAVNNHADLIEAVELLLSAYVYADGEGLVRIDRAVDPDAANQVYATLAKAKAGS